MLYCITRILYRRSRNFDVDNFQDITCGEFYFVAKYTNQPTQILWPYSQILDDFSPCREYRAGTIMRTLSDSQKYRKNNTDRDGHNNGRFAGF